MDYKNKYLKYKNKYLQLKNYNQIGGDKTKLTKENTNILKINSNDELDNYKKILIDLTKICEPDDEFEPIINEPHDIFWLVQYKETKKIIGYLKSSDLQQYEKNDNFELVGGIKDKKGLQISGVCNGNPNEYTNIGSLLLENIEEYARDNDYDYILLHAGTDREYLIGEGERKGLYIKNGFIKERILKAGSFSNIDVWIMYKYLNMIGGGNNFKIKMSNLVKN